MLKQQHKSFLENAGGVLLTKISMPAASFVVIILMARQLSPADLGKFSIVMSLYALFQFISVLGYDNIVIRDIAKDRTKSGVLIQNGVVLGFLSFVVCALLIILAGHLLNYSAEILKSIYLTTLVLFPAFLNTLCETVFIGLKKAQYAFYGSALREGVWVFLSVGLLCVFRNSDAVIMALFISRLIGALFFFYLLQKQKIPVWCKADQAILKSLAQHLTVFISINILSNVLLESDIIILSQLVPPEQVGFYSVVKKIIRMGFLIFFSAVMALFPIISEAVSGSGEKLPRYFKSFSFGVLAVAVLVTAGIYVVSGLMVVFFFGTKFAPSAEILRVLVWKIIPLSLSFLWSRFLISVHRQNKDMQALSIGLIVFMALGIFWTKQLGWFGMALADLTAVCIVAGFHFYFVQQFIKPGSVAAIRGAI